MVYCCSRSGDCCYWLAENRTGDWGVHRVRALFSSRVCEYIKRLQLTLTKIYNIRGVRKNVKPKLNTSYILSVQESLSLTQRCPGQRNAQSCYSGLWIWLSKWKRRYSKREFTKEYKTKRSSETIYIQKISTVHQWTNGIKNVISKTSLGVVLMISRCPGQSILWLHGSCLWQQKVIPHSCMLEKWLLNSMLLRTKKNFWNLCCTEQILLLNSILDDTKITFERFSFCCVGDILLDFNTIFAKISFNAILNYN